MHCEAITIPYERLGKRKGCIAQLQGIISVKKGSCTKSPLITARAGCVLQNQDMAIADDRPRCPNVHPRLGGLQAGGDTGVVTYYSASVYRNIKKKSGYSVGRDVLHDLLAQPNNPPCVLFGPSYRSQ